MIYLEDNAPSCSILSTNSKYFWISATRLLKSLMNSFIDFDLKAYP